MFFLATQLQANGDKHLASRGMTVRQWMFTVALEHFGDYAPTLNEVAKLMSCSHQNAKQLALKLQSKEFLNIERDANDGRSLRLRLTEKCKVFWCEKAEEDLAFLESLFKNMNSQEITGLFNGFKKLSQNIGE